MNKKNISKLQLTLTIIYVVALLVSNIIAGKQCLFPHNIVLGGGIFCFPITYILSDIFSEIYGYKYSRYTNLISFISNLFMSITFIIAINWNYPTYWQNQEAFSLILGNTPRILIASLSAFVFGDWTNDIIFKIMKNKHPNSLKGFKYRAILSSVIGNTVDALIFIPIAFIGTMPLMVMINTIFWSTVSKTLYETILLPITNIIIKQVYKYETT